MQNVFDYVTSIIREAYSNYSNVRHYAWSRQEDTGTLLDRCVESKSGFKVT